MIFFTDKMISEIKTFFIAMWPLVELRGAIPVAMAAYKLPAWSAYFFSVLGNLVPLILIILLLDPFSRLLSGKSDLFKEFFAWLYRHTRAAQQTKMEKFGKSFTVVLLVAIPIPFVGGWTGAIAASVFGLSFKKALPLVVTGSLIAGLIVLALTLLGQQVFGLVNSLRFFA